MHHIFILLLFLASWQIPISAIASELPNFQLGESLTYEIRYGWLDAGSATMNIDNQFHTINGKQCYKIDILGETKGVLHFFLKAKNEFCSYLDASQLISQGFYRCIQEGTYRKNERVRFDHQQKVAIVENFSSEEKRVQPYVDMATFPICPLIQDIVSNWYVLRTLDFKQIKVGQILSNPIFFDNILYENFQTKFAGKKRIKTKLGTIDTLILAPVVPFGTHGPSIFAEENAVELFISNDENKIPIKIKIKLAVGAVEIDLIAYKGLKHEVVCIKK